MTPQSALAKGKELEKYIVQWLKESGLDDRAARNPGSGNGLRKGDVDNDLGLSIECKNTKSFQIEKSFLQADRQSLGYLNPVLIWHPPQKPLSDSLVVITLHHFEELLKKSREPKMQSPDRTMNYALMLLKVAINEVAKHLK